MREPYTSRCRSSTGTTTIPGAARHRSGPRFFQADISAASKLHTDIERLRQGGLGGQFWSVYVPSTMPPAEAVRATLEQIDVVHRMMRQWPQMFATARTAAEVERVFKSGASPR